MDTVLRWEIYTSCILFDPLYEMDTPALENKLSVLKTTYLYKCFYTVFHPLTESCLPSCLCCTKKSIMVLLKYGPPEPNLFLSTGLPKCHCDNSGWASLIWNSKIQSIPKCRTFLITNTIFFLPLKKSQSCFMHKPFFMHKIN